MPTFKERLEAIEKKIANGEPVKEDLIKEINIIKEDLKAAGIKYTITDEMIEEITSEKNIQTYNKSKKIAKICQMTSTLSKKIDDMEKEAAESGKDLQLNVSGPLSRSTGYLFKLGDLNDPEILAENQKIAKLMNSPETVKAILRKHYQNMLNTDENLLFLTSYEDILEYMSTDTRTKLMYWETVHVLDDAKDLDFTPKELEQFKLLIPTFQRTREYDKEISKRANLLSFIMPELPGRDFAKLFEYYTRKGEPEKAAYCQTSYIVAKEGTQYLSYAYDIYKEKGVVGNGYELMDYYDENNEIIRSGKSTIADELALGSRKYVRFVIHSHDEKGSPLDKEVIVTREEIIQRYNDEQIQKLNSDLSDTLDDTFLYQIASATEFDSDPLKAAAQKSCLIYQLRNSKEYKEADDRGKIGFFNDALNKMKEGRDETYNFILTKSQSASLELIKDISSDDKSRSRKAYEKYKSIRSILEKEASVKAPGQSVLSGMLAPKPDISKLISPDKLTSEQGKMIKKAYEAINSPDSVLPIPDGWNEHDVSMLTLSTLLQPRFMAEIGKLAYGNGPTQQEGINYELYGMTNFFENMLRNDDRFNVQTAIIQAPKVRKDVQTNLAHYSRGNVNGVAFALKSGFDKLKENLRGFSSMDSNGAYSASKYLIDVYDFLQRPEFADFVKFSKDDLDAVKLAKEERKLLTEMVAYEKEIQQICDEKIYGDPESNPRTDEHINNLVKNYYARKLYFAKVSNAKQDLDMELRINPDTAEVDKNQRNKRLTIVESNLISDPEGYIDNLKSQITDESIPAFDKFTRATRWYQIDDSLLTNVKISSKSSAEYIFTEKARTKNLIANEYISKIPEIKATKKLRSLIENLPCMKDELPDDFKDPEARAAEYERVANLLEEMNLEYEELSDNPSKIKYKNSKNIGAELKSIAANLREGNALYKKEREFQVKTIQKEMDSHKELSNNEINARIEAQEKRLDEAEQKYGKTFCGHMPVKVLRQIADDRLNGYLDFYKKDTQMKKLLTEAQNFIRVKSFSNNLIEELEKYQEQLSEKMLDDDSVEIVNKYTAITNVINDYAAIHESPLLSFEAEQNPEIYQTPYEQAQKEYDDVSEILKGIDRENEPELYKLGENARIALENIRDAISNEAYTNTKDGIESLKKDSSIAAVSAFSIVMKSEPGSELRKKLEEIGADKVIKDANKSEPVKSSKKNLNIRSIGKALGEKNGFREFIKKSPDKQANNEKAKVSEIGDPSLNNPALGGSGGPSAGGN